MHARVPVGGLAFGRVLGASILRSASLAIFFLTLTFAASSALAAEIVDVRVGQHPTFTRVVFELDSAAGYQLSKASSAKSGEELVVILQASSIPRSVQAPRKSLLGLVRVAPEGATSIARIELKQSGLVVKERIMSSPYRVVLDVIDPKAEAAAKTAAARKAAPKAAAAPPPKPAPKPAPKAAPKPAAVKPAPKPAPKAAPPAPAPKAAPPAQPKPTAAEEDDLLGAADAAPAAGERRIGQAPLMPTPRTATREPSEGGIATMGQAEKAAPPKKKPSGLPKAKMADADDGSFGSVLMIGSGALLAVFALLFLMRMRARKNRETEAAIEEEAADSGPLNPFASLRGDDEDDAPRPAAPPPPAPAAGDDSQLTLDSLVDGMPSGPPGEADAPDVIGETELEETTISVRNADGEEEPFAIATEEEAIVGTASAVTQTGADDHDGDDEEIGEEEMSRLIQQFEQRIASLESRIDEQAEARERLERQVAAQTEELRVQRAAIARTQRAVRNITRGEEEGPTEPALRDPNG